MGWLKVAWDIYNSTKIVQPEDIDPELHDEEANNWFMCPVCRTDLAPGELVSRMPVIDGQVFVAWNLMHPLCVAKLMIDEAAAYIEWSVGIV